LGSFCFRTIEEFAQKMIGYSHADRVGGDKSLLDPKRIQETICKGEDIFDMLPEAYTYKDMFALLHLEPYVTALLISCPSY
jgi:beta-1,4-mannosyl-glycoprotein beta-1,4-N-acetylglucosaminyltransferase